jgi:hypothetical protein
MERKMNPADHVNEAFESIKSIQPSELPFGFSDRVVNNLHSQNYEDKSQFHFSPLLRMAAIFVLVLINIFALRLVINTQPAPGPSQYITIKDFVSEYQINDTNDELLTSNSPAHE